MLIAQITDLHIGVRPISDSNDTRLRKVVARLKEIGPDVVLATGDLTEDGELSCYHRLKELLAPLSAPLLPVIGNHDLRQVFIEALGVTPDDNGFVQYASPAGDLRILVLDTVETGRHGGAFCDLRAAWLTNRLDEQPDTPTLIALHHPPVKSGIAWMDVGADGAWSERLKAVLTTRPQVIGLIAGHVHRPFVTTFAGSPLIVAPSCAPQVVLDLEDEGGGRDRDRPRIVEEDPGFALHLWKGGQLTSHFGTAGEHRVIAMLDAETGRIQARQEESRPQS